MKRIFLPAIVIILLTSMQLPADTEPQQAPLLSPAISADSAVVSNIQGLSSFRINAENTQQMQKLLHERQELQKRLDAEMSKRNTYVPGATHEALEEYNDRQDSLCLALKSELVDINLQIAEIRSKKKH